MRDIKFRVYTEIKPEVLGMKYFDLHDTSEANNTIMQYTGLKDKNEKEIYEGDICRCLDIDCIGEIVYEKRDIPNCCCSEWECISFYFKYYEYGDIEYMPANSRLEVIGNVYENSDLLKKGEIQ